MNAAFASRDLDTLAADLVAVATDFLPAGSPARILSLELGRQPTVALIAETDGGPRVVARYPMQAAEHEELFQTGGILAARWLDMLPLQTREAVGSALHQGGRIHVYCHADGQLALGLSNGEQTVELAHRIIENATELH